MKCKCDNCGHICDTNDLKVDLAGIPDLEQRLDVDGPVPAGECPECGALTYAFDHEEVKQRLEYLRGEIEAERISYGEIDELQSLIPHIDPGDVQLLEWAGVPEVQA